MTELCLISQFYATLFIYLLFSFFSMGGVCYRTLINKFCSNSFIMMGFASREGSSKLDASSLRFDVGAFDRISSRVIGLSRFKFSRFGSTDRFFSAREQQIHLSSSNSSSQPGHSHENVSTTEVKIKAKKMVAVQ